MLPSLKLAVWKPLKRGQFGKGRLPSTIFRGSTWYHALQKSPPQGDLGEIARNITTNIEKPFTQRERETWLILTRLHEIFEPPFFSECLALIPKFNVTGTFKNHKKNLQNPTAFDSRLNNRNATCLAPSSASNVWEKLMYYRYEVSCCCRLRLDDAWHFASLQDSNLGVVKPTKKWTVWSPEKGAT